MTEKNEATNIVTGVVRLAWPALYVPKKAPESDKEMFSCALLIKKDDAETIANLKRAREAAIAAKFGGTAPARLKSTIRDGDEYEDENMKGHLVLNVSSKYQPGVVDRRGQAIIDSTEVYSGCYVRASIYSYGWEHATGGKGISFGLKHIMKWEDGEPMGGFSSAEDDFAEIIDPNAAPSSSSSSDLGDLL